MKPYAGSRRAYAPVTDGAGSRELRGEFVSLTGITKHFRHITALDHADLTARPGEVTAICGDNGAGKSTLMNVLTGLIAPEEGEIRIGDETLSRLTVPLALERGVSAVYQDLALANSMDVTANLFLGREISHFGFLDRRAMRQEAEELIRRLDVNIPDLSAAVGELSGGQRQAVAVARVLLQGGRILIFDEPTAAMGIAESAGTMKLIRSLADRGLTVFLISHNLAQIREVSDRIAVMRHGQVIREDAAADLPQQELLAMLSGGGAAEKGKGVRS
jgi:ABC-type sugar transport system ATPase subunit